MLNPLGRIDHAEAMFLRGEIESGNNDRSKRALQTLCRLYRHNKRLQPRDIMAIENAILGALSSGRSDEKVRRWCLSALSQFGTERACWAAVENTIKNFPDEPQVISSGIAALFKMNRKKAPTTLLANNSISSEILTLSALQTMTPNPGELPSITLDVDSSDSTSLKLGLVLVGLNRSPDSLFDRKHSNREMVKQLGGHHDALVSQYSAWAIAENPNLTVSDLGIDCADVAAQPDNVRHYVYRLFAAENSYSVRTFDMVSEGSVDDTDEVRLGTAIGLRDTYYEGLQDLTLNWFYREENHDVRAHLLDHIVRHSEKQDLYQKNANDLFSDFASDGGIRDRMMAAAAGMPISKVFKRILHEEDEGLFGAKGETYVTNYNTNNGSMQGNNSLSGNAENSGQQMNVSHGFDQEKLIKELIEAKSQISLIQIDEVVKNAAIDALTDAQSEPTPSKINTAVAAVRKIGELLGPATAFGASVMTIATGISSYL